MCPPIAILTGDLIGSTAVEPSRIEATMSLLAKVASDISDAASFTRYRGDGWQMLLPRAGDCLWGCLYITARLRAVKEAIPTRIAAGIGTEWPTGRVDLSTAMGPAFTASGRALDRMRPGETLALAGDGIDAFQQQCFAFAADLARRWTPQQAEAVALMLHVDSSSPDTGPSRAAAAARLHITRQAVDARLKAADYDILSAACDVFRTEYAKRGAADA